MKYLINREIFHVCAVNDSLMKHADDFFVMRYRDEKKCHVHNSSAERKN